jgi:glycosyltransferase involved in cell wall biosynthesis
MDERVFGAPAATPFRATVLVIAYRMAGTIVEALASVLAQDEPCEVLVSDDCSGDDALDRCAAYLAGYAGPHRVRVRATAANRGLCGHLVELAGLASAPVLVFQAGDDASKPGRVRALLAELEAHPEAMLVGSTVDDVDAGGALLVAATRGQPRRMVQRDFLRAGSMCTVLGASMAVRRTLLTDLPPLAGKVEDNMLSLRAALLGEVRCLPEPLLRYRRHDANLGDWVFDRSGKDYATWERRQRRVAAMYDEIADDQERCVAACPQLDPERRRLGLALATLYRREAAMRHALLSPNRRDWLRPLWVGLRTPGLRRKSLERALKLLVPRRWFGRRG